MIITEQKISVAGTLMEFIWDMRFHPGGAFIAQARPPLKRWFGGVALLVKARFRDRGVTEPIWFFAAASI
jgi:hypothetical protein